MMHDGWAARRTATTYSVYRSPTHLREYVIPSGLVQNRRLTVQIAGRVPVAGAGIYNPAWPHPSTSFPPAWGLRDCAPSRVAIRLFFGRATLKPFSRLGLANSSTSPRESPNHILLQLIMHYFALGRAPAYGMGAYSNGRQESHLREPTFKL